MLLILSNTLNPQLIINYLIQICDGNDATSCFGGRSVVGVNSPKTHQNKLKQLVTRHNCYRIKFDCQNTVIRFTLHWAFIWAPFHIDHGAIKKKYKQHAQQDVLKELYITCRNNTSSVHKGHSEIIAVTTPSISIKSEIFAFW